MDIPTGHSQSPRGVFRVWLSFKEFSGPCLQLWSSAVLPMACPQVAVDIESFFQWTNCLTTYGAFYSFIFFNNTGVLLFFTSL